MEEINKKKSFASNRTRTSLLLLALCLINMLFLIGCVTTDTMVSSSIDRNEIRLGDYKSVFVYQSEQASFIELELEQLFESAGLKVIGIKEANNFPESSVLGVRYTEKNIRTEIELTIQLIDYTTDKSLFTTRSSSGYGWTGMPKMARKKAWKEVLVELKKVF
jgi:hypothetical protein|tara:strand:+ start:283 stop:771 length:489 start_codon:yes stop_codon:yes gene_type:complete